MSTDPAEPQTTHRDLTAAQVEQWMASAWPRLIRVARAQGIPDDAASDVAQETLLEAWRHLDALTRPAGFDAWLGAICRNVCRRHLRARHVLARRETLFDATLPGEESDDPGVPTIQDVPDPMVVNPLEALDRQDLATLLDRALGHLPASARQLLELCYVAEQPQRETALRLGLTISALEARLHRARKQLRQVLSGPLRAEAEGLDIPLEENIPIGWRETRLWCPACGHQRLRGAFEPVPEDDINLHLRCPGCGHEVNSWGHVPLDDLRSFRPAYKRVMRTASAYMLAGLERGWLPCLACGAPLCPRIVSPEALVGHADEMAGAVGLFIVLRCAACHRHDAELSVTAALWAHPALQGFLGAHPRAVVEPEQHIEHCGAPAIRIRLTDVASAAQLTLLAHPATLHLLAIVRE